MRYRFLLLLPALAMGCSSAEDQAAKKRIFSPEDPPRVLQAAQEELAAASLHERPAMVERVFSISAQEAAFRLGPHVQNVKSRFTWKKGETRVPLSEERRVAVDPAGDFHVLVENDQRQGMEWMRVGGTSFSRSRHAKFRERRRDRGSSEHVLEEAYTSLAAFHRVVHGALKLAQAGSETLAGRKAIRYTVSLGEPWEAASPGLPEIVFPAKGPDEDTRLRLEAAEKGKTTSVSGTLWVDEERGVPLKAELQAVVEVQGEAEAARLELEVKLDVAKIGQPLGIEAPDHLDDAPRPPGAVGILEAYGLGAKDSPQME